MYELIRTVAAGIFLSAALSVTSGSQVAPFSSLEVPQGGHVVLRPGPTQRVTFLRGGPDYTRLTVTDAGALVIDKCSRKCPRGYRLEIEITTPGITRISLANGGTIQTRAGFQRQGDLAVAVAHGGTIDVRSIASQRVNATVEQGGRILTVPQSSLSARVTQGGAIVYWGNARVTQSIEHGGVVSQGSAGEIDLPLSAVGFPVLPHHTKVRGRR